MEGASPTAVSMDVSEDSSSSGDAGVKRSRSESLSSPLEENAATAWGRPQASSLLLPSKLSKNIPCPNTGSKRSRPSYSEEMNLRVTQACSQLSLGSLQGLG